jgi:hypothetical protein
MENLNEIEIRARAISVALHEVENKGKKANTLLCSIYTEELKARLPKEAIVDKCFGCGVKIIYNPFSLNFCTKNHIKICKLCGLKPKYKMKPLTKQMIKLGLK